MQHVKKLLSTFLIMVLVLGLLPSTIQATEEERQAQDVSAVLSATLAQLAATVTEPAFGTNAGEWTVFCLARGNYYEKDHAYYAAYYDRIVEYVNKTASGLDMNGALHKSKSTDNSRLVMALAAIGIDATAVGDWNIVEAYSANGINWIRKQGLNGTIWTLIALDCGNYETSVADLRQLCVDDIVAAQHNDGGWSLVTNKTYTSNVDITGMALTALYPYRDQPAVAIACEQAIQWLSESQLENGGFPYGSGETSESCAWAIVATTTWGINPDTDPRFIKNGNSPIDNLLTYYVAEEARFEHARGAGSNAMATDQCCYALVAYDRFLKGKPGLYDYSDVTFTTAAPTEITAALKLPAQINAGDAFKGNITVDNWDNSGNYKLLDFMINVPEGVTVTDVTAGSRLSGGTVSFNTEKETGKLRVVYFDAAENSNLILSGEEFPAELFTVSFSVGNVSSGKKLDIGLSGMSIKCTSDSEDDSSMIVVKTENPDTQVQVTAGLSFTATCLYTGDDVDLIASTKKAVAVAVTGINGGVKLSYKDSDHNFDFYYSAEISAKSGVATYVALVDAAIEMENFVNARYFSIATTQAAPITFGDANGDGVVNAQDALAVVDSWLRKGDAPTDTQCLAMNVNGDSRINTFDALGIVEAFVNKQDYIIVTKASSITAD